MKMERTKNAAKNILFGWILQVFNMLLPFAVRTAMIYIMGVEYLGLNSLFISIISVLNLAELGVGNAMVYSMYRPIVENDTDKICKLMNLYRRYYRIIGWVIFFLGSAVTPFLPQLIKSDLPVGINIYILYFLNLAATVTTYWLFSYKNSLLYAFQQTHIESKITIAVNTIKTICQLLLLYLTHNYYIYLVIAIVFQIVTNLVTAFVTNKMFPQYKAKGKLEKEEVSQINHRIKDLFTSKFGMAVINQVDTIIISAFLGLTALAIYQNYFYILSSVRTIITIALHACVAAIGNSIIVESKKKNLNDLNKLTFIVCWVSGWCMCCFLSLYQPFMKIWMGESLMLQFSAVICFSAYFYVLEINQLWSTYKEAAGLWHEDRFRPLLTAIVNLVLNLVLVRFLGIYGIIFSTLISTLVVGMPWLLHNLFNVVFDKGDLNSYLKRFLRYTLTAVFVSAATCFVCSYIQIGNWSTLILRFVVCITMPNLIYILLYFRSPEMKDLINLIDVITNKRFRMYRFIK